MNWINVKDSLPEKDEYVLTYRNQPTMCIRVNWFSTLQNKWMISNEWDTLPVTHWMPLPEAPKEESK